MGSDWFVTFGQEGVARAAILTPLVIFTVGAIRQAAGGTAFAAVVMEFSPVISLVIGAVFNVLAEFAFADVNPETNVAKAVLIGVAIGATASTTYKIRKSVPEMRTSLGM